MPLGYLDSLGVQLRWRISSRCTAWRWSDHAPIEQVFETYRFSGVKPGQSMEGHVMLTFDAKLVKERITHPRRLVLGSHETARARA